MSAARRARGTEGPSDGPATTTQRVVAARVIAILRAPTAKHFLPVADALVAAGVQAIEITLTAPDALDAIARVSAEFGRSAVIGAGTVLTADEAEACIDAGAAFLVSPTAAPDVVAAAQIAGVAAYPAGLTPTEVVGAYRSGATAVKLFPASAVGPRFIADLHGPFPDIPIIPTGGIAIEDIPDWIAAGAVAVGLGGPLLGDAARDGRDIDGLRKRARRALAFAARAGTRPERGPR
jgi:2-dehydro-3-deoxyphosphogluconate aldolase / (4S)-4-hydroxy-2-oxoglutarate aldolase